jgi:LacI family transcriptional regulator
VGLVACNDMRAYQVLNIRDDAGIKVPDEVAVIGVNNDRILCELSDLLLSSVDPDASRIGYEAAAVLHRLIERRGPVPKTTLIAPRGVVARQSTDMLTFANPELVQIVRYLRDHACKGLTVDTLVRRMAVSRATLCRWFASHLGHSPVEEMARVRVERVKELLATTTLRLEEVARRCGFDHSETMYRLFKRATGQTPGEYRSAHGAATPACEF